MIKSMTAFAREEGKQDFGVLVWEIRSINHRHLEPFIRLPEAFRGLEADVRGALKQHLHRGKIECTLNFDVAGDHAQSSVVNRDVVKQLAVLCDDVKRQFSSLQDVSALEILKWPGVLETAAIDIEMLSQKALALLNEALKELVAGRLREGAKLREALDERLDAMEIIVSQVRKRMPEILALVRERLRGRFDELSVQLDNDRLEQEMVLITQKSDVEEELTRLDTHIHEVRRILTAEDNKPVGRRLDFLMQELNREANTLCSKSMDSESTKAGIDLKVYIEQMREQVQNIE
ncbi:MAG TPA: YicC family protein [Gammaproteobacteria bacterium]|nr:YicC family protein [Gammaproteobacteria bacterium]